MISSIQGMLEHGAHRALDMSSGEKGQVFALIVHPAGIHVEVTVLMDNYVARFAHLISWAEINMGAIDILDAALDWVSEKANKAQAG